jgi:hypothetical protein
VGEGARRSGMRVGLGNGRDEVGDGGLVAEPGLMS